MAHIEAYKAEDTADRVVGTAKEVENNRYWVHHKAQYLEAHTEK